LWHRQHRGVGTNANTKLTENTGMQFLTEVSFVPISALPYLKGACTKTYFSGSPVSKEIGPEATPFYAAFVAMRSFLLMDFGPVTGVRRNSVQVHARRPHRKMYQK
jgi:hypothetical protein